MKLETFFEKFELFADAPDAVAKMRELVLRLAVQGELVEQDGCERSAIKCVRDANKAVVPLETLAPSATPVGWVALPLGCVIASNIGGGTPSKSDPDFWGGDIPWASVKDVTSEKYITSTIDSITKEGLTHSSSNLIPAGRLIVVTRMGLGKVAINKIPVAINQDLRAIEPTTALDIDFAYLLFKSLKLVGVGVTVKGISVKSLHEISVLLPPLVEQKRIVAKVDELMALCDRLEAQQQERETRHAALARASLPRFAEAPTPANLEFLFHNVYDISPADLRKSILTLAVQGKLVPFDADANGGTVGDHIDFQNGYAFKSEWFRSSGIRLCRNTNVAHGVLDWREPAFVSERVAKEFERFALKEGDIVLSLDRPLISTGLKVAQIRKVDLPCLLLQRVARPVPKHDQLHPSYFMLWLNSPEFINAIDPGRSNGVPHISTRQVQQLPLVLPPLPEQHRIVAKVDELMALVDKLEAQLASARSAATDLLAAAVAELTRNEQQVAASVPPPEFERAAVA